MVDDPGAWEEIKAIDEAPFTIDHPWHFVCEIDKDWSRLRLTADGRWKCLGDAIEPCDARGHVGLMLAPDQLLIAKCAPGALIGKLGGSSSGRDDGTVFAIGSRCIVPLNDKKNTFLYIGINGAVPRASHQLDRIKLEVFGAPTT